jgi:Predicted AAA-ATPase
MRLPIGIQDFPTMRQENMVYVDKTMRRMPLLEGGRYFFARPRRFGKSLLLSTLQAAFSGNKALFAGLWLEQQFDFKVRPVVRIDFSKLDYLARSLEESLLEDLRQTAKEFALELRQNSAKSAFEELILLLSQRQKVMVLIDEYVKPITDHLFDEQRQSLQATLKSFYGALKSLDAHLHLVLLTGVSKIGKLNLFSDLNNLLDISLNQEFALLCGYTRQEIDQHFD